MALGFGGFGFPPLKNRRPGCRTLQRLYKGCTFHGGECEQHWIDLGVRQGCAWTRTLRNRLRDGRRLVLP